MTQVFAHWNGARLELRIYLGQTTTVEAITVARSIVMIEGGRVQPEAFGIQVCVTHQGVTVVALVDGGKNRLNPTEAARLIKAHGWRVSQSKREARA